MEQTIDKSKYRHDSYSAQFFFKRMQNMFDLQKHYYPSVNICASENLALAEYKLHRSTFFDLVSMITSILDGTIHCGAKDIQVTLGTKNSVDLGFSFACEGDQFKFMEMGQEGGCLHQIRSIAEGLGAKFAFRKTLNGVELRFSLSTLT